VDVEPSKFIDEAERCHAQIVGASALMTFTASNMKLLNEYFEMEGIRKKYKLIFGGGPITEPWAREMGADAYAQDAVKAVEVVNDLIVH
jgi:methanogenic corrinoid protein MtbC1